MPHPPIKKTTKKKTKRERRTKREREKRRESRQRFIHSTHTPFLFACLSCCVSPPPPQKRSKQSETTARMMKQACPSSSASTPRSWVLPTLLALVAVFAATFIAAEVDYKLYTPGTQVRRWHSDFGAFAGTEVERGRSRERERHTHTHTRRHTHTHTHTHSKEEEQQQEGVAIEAPPPAISRPHYPCFCFPQTCSWMSWAETTWSTTPRMLG